MLRIPRCVLLSAALVAGLVCAGAASAQLRDEADLFRNPEKISQAIKDIERKFGKTILVETSASVPAADAARVKAMERDKDKDSLSRYFSDFAKTNARRHQVDGLYISINKSPRWLEIVANKKTDPLFPVEKRRELRQKIAAEFKEKKFDEGMLAGLAYIRDQFSRTIPGGRASAPGNAVVKHVPQVAKTPGGQVNWGGIICIGLVVLAVIWLVIGLIRAMTGPRGGYAGGGPGGGPGYGGGYGGGGGGGFMTGLLGGMFGAVAGNWLYHNMLGGGGQSSSWGSQAYGGDATSNPAGDDYTSTGGTWDDNAGGDQGGGGGGDAGGDAGGDWGGGGGDAGGGGGDWGGGGGGDWGGGGGDFGGGGGGGDW